MKHSKFFLGLGMMLGVISTAFILLNMNNNFFVSVEPTVYTRTWHRVELPFLGDADPGAGNSGIIEFWVLNHTTAPTTDYDQNVSNTVYANSTVNDTHAGSDVPYSTAFDIVLKVRWNNTHAYNGSAFDLAYTRVYMNCTGLSVTAQIMEEALIGAEGTTYQWVNYYLQDANGGSGSGFTITKGQNVTSCSFVCEAYY